MYSIDALPEGTILGNYRLLKVLGQGGFGITYVAWDGQLERSVVIKECFPSGICVRDATTGSIQARSEDTHGHYLSAMAALKREARILAALNHERIVRVYEVFESYGSIFYVMPWLEGGSLKDKMQEAEESGTPIPPEQVSSWLRDVLSALKYLHGRELYHRDIKPANILFDEHDRPVLIDFGAALNMPEVTATITQGEFSYAYGSPEQIIGKGDIGPWTDFYALSSTWYQLICGMGIERADARLLDDETEPLTGMQDLTGYAPAVLAAIDQNLALQGAQRYQHVDQWFQALGDAPASPPQLPQQSPKQARNKPLLTLVAIGLVLVAIGGYLWMTHEPPVPNLVPEPMPPTNAPSPSAPEISSPKLTQIAEATVTLHREWQEAMERYAAQLQHTELRYIDRINQEIQLGIDAANGGSIKQRQAIADLEKKLSDEKAKHAATIKELAENPIDTIPAAQKKRIEIHEETHASFCTQTEANIKEMKRQIDIFYPIIDFNYPLLTRIRNELLEKWEKDCDTAQQLASEQAQELSRLSREYALDDEVLRPQFIKELAEQKNAWAVANSDFFKKNAPPAAIDELYKKNVKALRQYVNSRKDEVKDLRPRGNMTALDAHMLTTRKFNLENLQ